MDHVLDSRLLVFDNCQRDVDSAVTVLQDSVEHSTFKLEKSTYFRISLWWNESGHRSYSLRRPAFKKISLKIIFRKLVKVSVFHGYVLASRVEFNAAF